MDTVEEKVKSIVVPAKSIQDEVQDRIADLPDNLNERSKRLREIRGQLESGVRLVRDELDKVLKQSLDGNKTPDEKVLAGISDRYALSSGYGVSREDFDTVLDEISTNEKTLIQLRRLSATGAEMTITSVTDGEIVLIDTVDNVNVELQEEFLSGLDEKEHSDVVSTLEQRFPEIEIFLQRADNSSGLNYYEYLLICEVIGAEPMPEDEYWLLQDCKSVDQYTTICWLLTKQETLDGGFALRGGLGSQGVFVREVLAGDRSDVRAGRPMLRVQRA